MEELSAALEVGLGCLVVIVFILVWVGAHFVFGKSGVDSFWLALIAAVCVKVLQEIVSRINKKWHRRNS
jgi:uncharacterized membrane protein YvlD (DUF360 family)